MEFVFLGVGIIALLAGLLLLFNPKYLIKLGEVLNRTLAVDEVIFSKRLVFGILLLIAGVIMIYRFISIP